MNAWQRGVLVLLLMYLPAPVWGAEDFSAWLADFRQEALSEGISEATVKAHLDGIEPIARVQELDRRQCCRPKTGKRLTYKAYVERIAPDFRVRRARQKYTEYSDLFDAIAKHFKVNSAFVVALWAVESDFGRYTGSFPTVAALATLAYDGRRGDFFRQELKQLLTLIDSGVITDPQPKGSWAGAMGQVQFMPSSIKNFAVDFDGDGKNDLWNSLPDALGSAANYLSKVGWKDDEKWGQRVRLPKGFDVAQTGHRHFRTQKEWRAMGVRGIQGPDERMGALIVPDGSGGPAFIVYDNFKVIRHWNRSNYFALAVCQLAEKIGD